MVNPTNPNLQTNKQAIVNWGETTDLSLFRKINHSPSIHWEIAQTNEKEYKIAHQSNFIEVEQKIIQTWVGPDFQM